MSSMIQNSIASVNNTTKKYYDNFTNVNAENLTKPLDGKGYLVENNLLTAPVEMAKDSYYTAKSLQKGIAGKANDHELGKLNDLGLKLGGLSIATYLMTKRSTPKTKAMEFIGFGAFLASMAVWPKVALQWPAQLIHGVNFRKQYVDEQGRKKYATQDPNYIPFDLYKGKRKSEDLNHIADRLHIAKDEKDRIEIAKEHVRKVSVQNNTLWMMTAGVATPIMTALTCNLLDKPLGKATEKYSNNKVNQLADKIDDYLMNGKVDAPKEPSKMKKLSTWLFGENKANAADNIPEMFKPYAPDNKLDDVLSSKVNKPLTAQDITQISETLAEGLDTETQKAAHRDLSKMLVADKTIVNENTVSNITYTLTEKLDSRYGEGFTASVLDSKKLNEHVNTFMEANGKPANGVLNAEQAENLRNSLTEFVRTSTEENTTLRSSRKNMVNSLANETINEVFAKNQAAVLTEGNAENISRAGRTVRKYRAVDGALTEVSHFKVEKAPETIAGNNWGDVTETLIKELNITPKELNEAKSSEELTAQLFTRKLEEVAKDEKRYKQMVENVASKMMELDTKLDNPRAGKKGVMNAVIDGIARNCDNTANELHGQAFSNLAGRFSGESINDSYVGTIKEAKVRRIKQGRVGSIQNAYMRLLHTMDFFKRAEESAHGVPHFSGNPELDKEIIAKGKQVLMSSHSGDFYTKNQTHNNVNFYKSLMWHVFGSGKMSDQTSEALKKEGHEVFGSGKTSMAQRVKNWAVHIKDLMGSKVNDFMPNHIEGNQVARASEKTPVAIFNKIACTPDNLLYNALKQKYNSNKWMKIFTTIGGIVFAGTVASQFAFGKLDSNVKTTK